MNQNHLCCRYTMGQHAIVDWVVRREEAQGPGVERQWLAGVTLRLPFWRHRVPPTLSTKEGGMIRRPRRVSRKRRNAGRGRCCIDGDANYSQGGADRASIP